VPLIGFPIGGGRECFYNMLNLKWGGGKSGIGGEERKKRSFAEERKGKNRYIHSMGERGGGKE